MKAKNLILAASLTLLGTAPAAWAQYPYRTYRSYEYRSQESSGMLQVVHSMGTTAQWMSRMADRNNRRPDDAEAVALDRLHDLSSRARHFEYEMSRYRQDPRHTEDDFQAVVDAYNAAQDSLSAISGRPYLDNAMERFAGYLDQLAPYYGREAGFRYR